MLFQLKKKPASGSGPLTNPISWLFSSAGWIVLRTNYLKQISAYIFETISMLILNGNCSHNLCNFEIPTSKQVVTWFLNTRDIIKLLESHLITKFSNNTTTWGADGNKACAT